MHDSLWQLALMSLAFGVVVLGVLCAALVFGVLYGLGKVLKQNEDYANRFMATDWPSYVGFVQSQHYMIPESQLRAPQPPMQPLSDEDPVPEDGATVAEF